MHQGRRGGAAWPGYLGKGRHVLSRGQVLFPVHCAFHWSLTLRGGLGVATPADTLPAPLKDCQGKGWVVHLGRGQLWYPQPWHSSPVHTLNHVVHGHYALSNMVELGAWVSTEAYSLKWCWDYPIPVSPTNTLRCTHEHSQVSRLWGQSANTETLALPVFHDLVWFLCASISLSIKVGWDRSTCHLGAPAFLASVSTQRAMSALLSRMLGPSLLPAHPVSTIPSCLGTHQCQDGQELVVMPGERAWAPHGAPDSGWSHKVLRMSLLGLHLAWTPECLITESHFRVDHTWPCARG